MSDLTKEISSGEHKEVLWNKNGVFLRKWNEETQDYCPEQMRIVNKSILFTKDNWKTSACAIGEFHYVDPNDKTGTRVVETYGINAETLIGKLIMGEELMMTNSNGSMTFDDSGLSINTKNGNFSFSIANKEGKKVFDVDASTGNVKFSGNLEGATGSFNGKLISATGSFNGDVMAQNFTFSQYVEEESMDAKYMLGKIDTTEIPTDKNGMYLGIFYKTDETNNSYSLGAGFGVNMAESGYGDANIYGEEILICPGIGGCNIEGRLSVLEDSTFEGILNASEISVSGEKSRIVDTPDGTLSLHAYETPTPYFGDIGTSTLNDKGLDIIQIEYLFSNTINTNVEYSVFLQKEGQGDLWVSEKDPLYFIVRGTPNLKYSWELKAVQRDYECIDLNEHSDQLKLVADDKSDNEVSDILNGIISDLDREEENFYEDN